MIRRPVIVVTVALFVTACDGSATDATSSSTTVQTAASTTSTVEETTTTAATIVETSTTSTTPPASESPLPYLDGVDFPDDPQTIDQLPEFMQDWVDAPMPDPDLSLTGPDDVDRWLGQWLNWMGWAYANPGAALQSLDEVFVPQSPLRDQTTDALTEMSEGVDTDLALPFFPLAASANFEFFEEKTLVTVLIRASGQIGHSYVVDPTGSVVSVSESFNQEPDIRLALRYVDRGEVQEWVVESIDLFS